MSKVDKETQNTEQKIVTKYDLKMQRRKEEKAKAKKEKITGTIVGVVILVALAAWLISLPVRSYLTVHSTYVTIGNEEISKVEYDYNFYQTKASYVAQNGALMSSYMGIDITSDFTNQMYSNTMTWGDFFDEMTVDGIKRTKALNKEAKAKNFTSDIEAEYDQLMQDIKEAAGKQGISVGQFMKDTYGPYATASRIEDYIKESLYVTAYLQELSDSLMPTEEEITAHYNENKADYDEIDYRVKMVKAVLPTEPTELADPVEEGSETTEETAEEKPAYTPSEKEIEKAMADAKVLAEEALATIATEGELKEGIQKSILGASISDWLFADARKKGDTTVIEDANGKQYYVLAFEKKYRDDTPTMNLRAVVGEKEQAQSAYNEWQNGEATEDRFATICDTYNADGTVEGGLFKNITKGGEGDKLSEWLYAADRKPGDVELIEMDDSYAYLVYFVAADAPEWKVDIKSVLNTEKLTTYLDELTTDMTVVDPDNNLKYDELRALEAATAAAKENQEATEQE